MRRSKKAAVVEAPASEVAESAANLPEEASPESEVSAEAPVESLADPSSDVPEPSAVADPEHLEFQPVADDQRDQQTDAPAVENEDFDGISLDSLASLDEEPVLTEVRDPEQDSPLSDAFEPNEEPGAHSNVVAIDGDQPDDMEAFLCGMIEALLFTSQKPLPLKDLARSAGIDRPRARELVERLMRSYAPRGINIDEVAGGYVLRSSPRYAPQIQKFLSLRPVRLSRAQLETLAIVAYRQPVTKPEVDDIRGVDSGQVLKGLVERDLLKTLGKKDEPGRPMLYGTTNDFLELLNLRSLGELPTLREYTELSDESKRKFAEETGEEAPNELPLADADAAAAESPSGAEASAMENTAEEARSAEDPAGTPEANGSNESEAASAALEGEPLAEEGAAAEAPGTESDDVEALDDLGAAASEEGEPDDDEPDDDEDEPDDDEDEPDEDDEDEPDDDDDE
ncbi:MAG TPA: SMC-Scp complex subunit ScpB [Polyangiaceae bacterium]|nr:SMC-Scp complex subunit ScpB [Polyangiaceae bacterium]